MVRNDSVSDEYSAVAQGDYLALIVKYELSAIQRVFSLATFDSQSDVIIGNIGDKVRSVTDAGGSERKAELKKIATKEKCENSAFSMRDLKSISHDRPWLNPNTNVETSVF